MGGAFFEQLQHAVMDVNVGPTIAENAAKTKHTSV